MLQPEVITYIRARYTLLYLLCVEEQRVLEDLAAFAQREKKKLLMWSMSRGTWGTGLQGATAKGDPVGALEAVSQIPDNTLVVLVDFHPYLDDPSIVRMLRELAIDLEATNKTLLLLSPVLKLPAELDKDLTVVDFPLPDFALLEASFHEITGSLPASVKLVLSDRDVEKLVRSAQGLTLREFSNVLAKTLVTRGRIDKEAIDVVNTEKRQIIRKSGILDFYAAKENFGSVGGLNELKRWLDSRGRAFTAAAQEFGLPWPRGILIVGVQGCGKSLSAKAVAQQWRLPLIKLDMGRLFAGLVGASEEKMRQAIRLAESVAPAVLWIDEIEKGLSGLGSSNTSDGGTTARVIGTFLTWMQEKTAPVFVIATSNDISAMPPELLRKGRFDEIFFVDLPMAGERSIIFQIHIAKRGRVPDEFDLAQLSAATRGHSGAEIEEAVVSGLFLAFERDEKLTTSHILEAVEATIPLSVVMEEKIASLRQWAHLRTRNASGAEDRSVDQKATIAERLTRIVGDA
jgi:SpoVK/Ycf46/Vps4 family AAA+-type ATPase